MNERHKGRKHGQKNGWRKVVRKDGNKEEGRHYMDIQIHEDGQRNRLQNNKIKKMNKDLGKLERLFL